MKENKKTPKCLAILPARAGSKRLPHKNILPLAGKPLIAWTIEAALSSKYINTVCVSTDDDDVIDIATKLGCQPPFRRPEHLSTDIASSVDVVLHALNWYHEQEIYFDLIILLQATSPLRSTVDINSAFDLYISKSAKSVVSVCETEHSPLWCNTLPSDLSMNNFIPENIKNLRSQDLPVYYRLNGAIYIVDTKEFMLAKELILNKNSYAFIMSQANSIDIDTELDFKIAEVMMKEKLNT